MTIKNNMTVGETLLTIVDSIETQEMLDIVRNDDSKTLTDAVDEICQFRIPRKIIDLANSTNFENPTEEEVAQAVLLFIRGKIEEDETPETQFEE